MNWKSFGCLSALILAVFASCQSSNSDPEQTGPQRVSLELSVDADHKVPDSISWMLGRDSGDAHLTEASGKTRRTDFETPRPIGSDLLWLDLWVAGMRTMRAPHVWNGSAVVVSSKDRVVYDSVALRLLAKIDSLRQGPDSIPRTGAGLVSLYASWLLAADARAAGFQRIVRSAWIRRRSFASLSASASRRAFPSTSHRGHGEFRLESIRSRPLSIRLWAKVGSVRRTRSSCSLRLLFVSAMRLDWTRRIWWQVVPRRR